MSQSIPTLFFPTNVVVVDDDDVYLNNLELAIADRFSLRTFNSPVTAADYLMSALTLDGIQSIDTTADEEFDFPVVEYHEETIYTNVFNAQRFSHVSTIICDYSMPEMNGIEFFTRLGNKLVNKILLTGKADLDVAVDAFNRGIIDKYIRKDAEIADIVPEVILELEEKAFVNISQITYKILNRGFFHDPYVNSLFHSVVQKYRICEYYLWNQMGCYLMLDPFGKIYFFNLIHDNDIAELIQGFNDFDNIDFEVAEAVRNKKAIPFCLSEEDKQRSPATWSDMLCDIHPIPQSQGYYYSVVEKSPDFFAQDITSFAAFRQTQDL